MKQKIIYWTPRTLSIAMVVFISLFALDVFWEGYDFWESIAAFIIHLLPTFVLIGIVMIAWKWEQIGGLLFITLGVFYMIMTANSGELLAGMVLTLPITLIGILFIVSGTKSQRNNAKQKKGAN
ncbi:hypothetical protein KKB10_00360 [Patescibacteria group bacterium]|nr:hypothetical protein [Patescibacteria group bacterium]MBU1075185.1 hypothetical protein [Patescibacteria group bacterium]MBU1951979.1 hypothetical protein [Patescibacteria group bacterium]